MNNKEKVDLKDLSDNAYIGFSVKARDTEHNREVHDWFDSFSKTQAGHNHTAALGILKNLVKYQSMFEELHNRLLLVEAKIEMLADDEEKVRGEDKNDTF